MSLASSRHLRMLLRGESSGVRGRGKRILRVGFFPECS